MFIKFFIVIHLFFSSQRFGPLFAVWRSTRAAFEACSVFVFLFPAALLSSARPRPLSGTEVDQQLQSAVRFFFPNRPFLPQKKRNAASSFQLPTASIRHRYNIQQPSPSLTTTFSIVHLSPTTTTFFSGGYSWKRSYKLKETTVDYE